VAEPGTLEEGRADAMREFRRAISARLAQFSGDEAGPVYGRVVEVLDDALAAAGRQALPPPDAS